MGKIKVVVLSLVAFMILIEPVSAACDLNETNKLKSIAANVKASYEVVKIPEDPSNYDAPDEMSDEENVQIMKSVMNINIVNITKDLYVTVHDSLTDKTKTYNYSNTKNGKLTIVQDDLTAVNKYTITVFSSSETNCANTKLFTVNLTTPYYNYFSKMAICEGIEDFYLCHEYLSVTGVPFEKFLDLAEQYKKGKIDNSGEEVEKEKEEDKGFLDFVKENKGIVIISIVGVIAVGGLVTFVVIKKQRSR